MATKGGGSLLGGADSTLASMSYREAMADVSPDLKSVYQDEVLNQAMFDKGVQDHFDTLYADNNALADELKDATTKAMAGLGTDYDGMELFNSHLTSMKDRMKALPKGKKGDFERSKIRAEMGQLLESSTGLDETITKIGTMIQVGDFNKHATGNMNMSLLKSIADGSATKEIIDGNLIYSINVGGKNVKMDRQALEDALVQEDPAHQSAFNKIAAGQNNKGKQRGTKFDRQGSINAYVDSFPSEKVFAANIHKNQGNLKYSFAEALTGKDGSESIYKALTNMGQTTIAKYDANKDGKITDADFANKENGIALIDSLTNIHGDNFDYQTAKKVAAEFYADNIDQVEFRDGVALRPKNPKAVVNNNTKSKFGLDLSKNFGSYYVNGATRQVSGKDVENTVETFKSVQDKGSGIFTGYNQIPYKLKNGKWSEWNSETEAFDKEANETAIFTNLGWNNNPMIMEYLKKQAKASSPFEGSGSGSFQPAVNTKYNSNKE